PSEAASDEPDTEEKNDNIKTEVAEKNTSEEENTTEKQEVKKVEPPDAKVMDEEFQKQVQQNLYVKDGAAYSAYYFVQDSATKYIDAVNRAAKELEGQTDVYCILVPNQSGALLSEEELNNMGGSSQMQAIDYYYGMLSGVKTVDTIKTLREHSDEYIYFRTDHHWTQLGAYYIYENFCKTKGITPIPLESRKSYTFENFLGTFYSTLQNADMAKNPDTVYAYIPNGTNDMTYWDEDGSEHEWNVVFDVEGWAESSLYMTFIGGDRPLEIIENPNITDGSSCLVLKESYGNAFVPLLVDHYQTVYVIDYRYAQVNVLDYVRDKQIDDLILINNITIIGSESVADTIDGLLQ
ncbi:MAG: DHHW family protein, partial [Coprococcus sp.]